ncbi:MAG: elongation factor G [Caulobacteraceae bacterium]
MERRSSTARAVALIGPPGAGKTTLLEALLFASGAIPRQGETAAGTSVGDASPEARQRGQSVELNLAGLEFLGDRFSLVDCPGAGDFACAAEPVLPAVDLAVVVVDPAPDKAVLAQPILTALEAKGVPHVIFVNRIDQAHGPLDPLIRALEEICSTPVVVRQLPMFEGEKVTGFIDLALERAYVYRRGQAPQRIDLPEESAPVEADARFHMLEQLADYDDTLLEQLLNDETPSPDRVFGDLRAEVRQGLITPVFLGSALNGFGVERLLKALRHEAPEAGAAAARLGIEGPAAYVFGVSYAGQAGKLAYARAFGAPLREGAELTLPDGARSRAGGLMSLNGGTAKKTAACEEGEIVALAKVDAAAAGMVLSADGKPREGPALERHAPLFAMAIAPKDRKDDVRLSTALNKLVEEDWGLSVRRDSQQTLIEGRGEAHLTLTLDRLRRRFGLDVVASAPKVPYRETIRRPATQRGRHKKQTGGHGQFADVLIAVKPADRGLGFSFAQTITGGAVPKHWIPSVEQGVRDALERGPLGFPVVDVEVVLTDGAFHAVDSSEMAFRTAGRIAMSEALAHCEPVLLEPVDLMAIEAPSGATPRITAAISGRRGQNLGFQPMTERKGWDRIEAYMPEAQCLDFIVELRGLTQGLGDFTCSFHHMEELGGRIADQVVKSHAPEMRA